MMYRSLGMLHTEDGQARIKDLTWFRGVKPSDAQYCAVRAYSEASSIGG
jgi:hypothetical protein